MFIQAGGVLLPLESLATVGALNNVSRPEGRTIEEGVRNHRWMKLDSYPRFPKARNEGRAAAPRLTLEIGHICGRMEGEGVARLPAHV